MTPSPTPHSAKTAPPQPPPTPEELPVLAVITNSGSTQNKSDHRWVEHYLAAEHRTHHFFGADPAGIRQAVNDAAAVGAEIIVVNGGDGTVDLVFASLLNDGPYRKHPALALLPSGKTNMTAAAWCGSADKHQGLQDVLRVRRAGHLQDRIWHYPILTVDTRNGEPPLRGAFLGAADVVDGILFCRKHIYPMGLPNTISHALAVGVLLWRGLFTRAGAPLIEAQWNDQAEGESGKFFFMGAMTLDKLILDLVPQSQIGMGSFRYISLQSGLGAALSAIPRLIFKTVTPGYKRNVRRAEKLTLAFDGPYTLDGELFDATRDRPLVITADKTLPFINLGAS